MAHFRPSRDLLFHTRNGNISGMKKALKNGADVDFIDYDGQGGSETFALKLAAASDNVAVVKLLLDKGANVDLTGEDGQTALMTACEYGNTKIAKLLLTKGAQAYLQDAQRKTALMYLCGEKVPESKFTKVAKLLLSSESVNCVDNLGQSALMIAFERVNYVAQYTLLGFEGTNLNIQDNDGLSVLMMASKTSRMDCVRAFLEYRADVNLMNKAGKTALVLACEYKKPDNAELLLSNGAHVDFHSDKGYYVLEIASKNLWTKVVAQLPIDVRNHKGQSIFMRACIEGEVGMSRLLLLKGANIDLQDNSGKTVLMQACELKMFGLTEFLLLKGADPNLQDDAGISALMMACEVDAPTVVHIIEELLQHRANVDLRDKAGQTALMKACNADYVGLLVDHGANVDLQDHAGLSPLMIACKKNLHPVANTLLLKGANVDLQNVMEAGQTALMLACKMASVDMAQLFLVKSAQVDMQDHVGMTALMIACNDTKSTDLIEVLLLYRATVDIQNNVGMSPLMFACAKGSTEIAEVLLKRYGGVNANFQQKTSGQTPLMLACKMRSVEMVKLLLRYGAQVDIQDHAGTTALMIACESESIEITKLLLNGGAKFNLQSKNSQTALMMVSGRESLLNMLLVCGAEVNTQDIAGQTALSIACKHGDMGGIELLLKSRAKVDLLDAESLSVVNAHGSPMVQHYIKMQIQSHKKTKESTLITASRKGEKDTIEQLLSEGAEIESKDSRGRTALITASGNGHTMVTDLLLERGAHIDSQDDQGYSALMTACQNGHVQTTSRLLDEDADTFLKNSEGKTAFDLAMENSNAELLLLFAKLRSKPSYPGILFLEGAKRETVTTKEKTIDLEEVGISLSIPEDALPPTDPPLQLEIQPCFSGSFDVPPDIELVSPAYVVDPSRKVSFQKKVLVKMWHHANLKTEEDCEDMVFLSASTSPEYRGDTPVYVFREIEGAKGSFRPGEEQPIGQIALKHFCALAVGRKRKHEDDEQESEELERKRKREDIPLESEEVGKCERKPEAEVAEHSRG